MPCVPCPTTKQCRNGNRPEPLVHHAMSPLPRLLAPKVCSTSRDGFHSMLPSRSSSVLSAGWPPPGGPARTPCSGCKGWPKACAAAASPPWPPAACAHGNSAALSVSASSAGKERGRPYRRRFQSVGTPLNQLFAEDGINGTTCLRWARRWRRRRGCSWGPAQTSA
jgi:hypothetical protein